MATRYYSSVAAETTLVASITNANTSIELVSVTGLPALTPFTLALDYEAATEELVEVTAVAGTTLTVTRAIDGTSAAPHNAGSRVRHVSSARDFADSRTHEETDTNVHGTGVGSAVVGTTDTQTLENKTLLDATGTLNRVDILSEGATGWVTTINGDIDHNTDLTLWKRGPSETHHVAGIANNGQVNIRNQNVAADSVFNVYRLRVVKDDGTTDIFSVLSGGTATAWTNSGQTGFQVKPRTTDNNEAIRVRNSADSATNFAVWNNGRVDINGSDPAFSQFDVHGASGQSAACMRVMNNDETVTHFQVSGAGNTTVGGNLSVTGTSAMTGNVTMSGTLAVTGTADFGTATNTGTSVATAASGFSVDTGDTDVVVKGGIATIRLAFLRTGGNLTANAAGNLTDTDLGTIAAAYRPDSAFGSGRMIFAYGTGFTSGTVGLNPSTGLLELLDAHSTSLIETNHTVRVTLVYAL